MTTWLLVLLGLALPANRLTVDRDAGTLIIVGATSSSIVLAADSLAVHLLPGIKPSTTNKKIIQIGKFAACFISGDASIRGLQNGKVVVKVDFAKTIVDWSKNHPNGQLAEAYSSIDAEILQSMKTFQGKTGFYADPVQSFTSFGCAGYIMGAPMLYISDYHAPTSADITEHPTTLPPLPPGYFAPLGTPRVSDEVTKANPAPQFSKFKNSALARYRKARESRNLSSITTKDLLQMSRMCLEATESPEGRAFDAGAKDVAPPNRYAVIDGRNGFRWVAAP